MELLNPFRRILDRRRRKRARDAIFEKLDIAYANAATLDVSLSDGRVIILSDQHKGARDGADDFQRCERSYNAALAYYNHLEYRLMALGDVEELWENSFDEVASNYPTALALEAKFHAGDRYTRFFGNHDIAWSDKELFQDKMAQYGVADVEPIEALRMRLVDGQRQVGELFLAHGHQGTPDSDLHARRSKFLVKYGWRRLQRRLNRPWNTPSVDWALRGRHAEDMAKWAEDRRRVLIAGHTHLPVFFENEKEPAVTPDQLTAPEGEDDPKQAEGLRLAREEWASAEAVRLLKQKPTPLARPCYFNTGCCSFGDGDITGIEISGGEIRLVRWPCKPETAEETLAQMSLIDVIEQLG